MFCYCQKTNKNKKGVSKKIGEVKKEVIEYSGSMKKCSYSQIRSEKKDLF